VSLCCRLRRCWTTRIECSIASSSFGQAPRAGRTRRDPSPSPRISGCRAAGLEHVVVGRRRLWADDRGSPRRAPSRLGTRLGADMSDIPPRATLLRTRIVIPSSSPIPLADSCKVACLRPEGQIRWQSPARPSSSCVTNDAHLLAKYCVPRPFLPDVSRGETRVAGLGGTASRRQSWTCRPSHIRAHPSKTSCVLWLWCCHLAAEHSAPSLKAISSENNEVGGRPRCPRRKGRRKSRKSRCRGRFLSTSWTNGETWCQGRRFKLSFLPTERVVTVA